MSRRGRRTLLDEARWLHLLEAFRTGMNEVNSARLVSLNPNTLQEWLRRGEGLDDRPAKEPYITFATEVRKAQAEFLFETYGEVRRNPDPRWKFQRALALEAEVDKRLERRQAIGSALLVPSRSVVLTAEQVERIALEQVRRSQGDTEEEDVVRARRARLVSGHLAND
jgi:hypothetical protein